MTQNNSSTGITSCVIVCWLLAFSFGIFTASAFIGWAHMHGLVAAVIGLIVMLVLGWLLRGMFCTDVVANTAVPASSTEGAIASEPIAKPVVEKTTAKKATTKKPATKKPAAKKTTTKKPAAKKAAVTKYYKSAPAKVDDLKLISGVGPKLARIIHRSFRSRGFCARKRFHICQGKWVRCAGFPALAFEFVGFSFGVTGRCAA